MSTDTMTFASATREAAQAELLRVSEAKTEIEAQIAGLQGQLEALELDWETANGVIMALDAAVARARKLDTDERESGRISVFPAPLRDRVVEYIEEPGREHVNLADLHARMPGVEGPELMGVIDFLVSTDRLAYDGVPGSYVVVPTPERESARSEDGGGLAVSESDTPAETGAATPDDEPHPVEPESDADRSLADLNAGTGFAMPGSLTADEEQAADAMREEMEAEREGLADVPPASDDEVEVVRNAAIASMAEAAIAWAQEQTEPWSKLALAKAIDVTRPTAASVIDFMIADGRIEPVGTNRWRAVSAEPTPEPQPAPTTNGSRRGQSYLTLEMVRDTAREMREPFNGPMLAAALSAKLGHDVPVGSLAKYIKDMHSRGWLERTGGKLGPSVRYQFLKPDPSLGPRERPRHDGPAGPGTRTNGGSGQNSGGRSVAHTGRAVGRSPKSSENKRKQALGFRVKSQR